jgi:hypothetical protein
LLALLLSSVLASNVLCDSYRRLDGHILTVNEAAGLVAVSAGLLPISASGYAKPQTRLLSTWERSSNNTGRATSNSSAAKRECPKVNLSTAWIRVSNGQLLATFLLAFVLTGRSPPAIALSQSQFN